MPDRPLWSERQGGSLPLTKEGFSKLIERLLERCMNLRLLEEAFDIVGVGGRGDSFRTHDPDEFFTQRLGDPWAARFSTIRAS